MPVDLKFVEDALARHGDAPESVIPILQAIQDHYSYLPAEGLLRVCEATRITPAAIAGVSSFYDMFRHEPAGKYIVQICHGTACHVGGAERVESALRQHLGIAEGAHTDARRLFTLERVACLGCCTLAPVLRIADETIGNASAETVSGAVGGFLASRNQRQAETTPLAATGAQAGGLEIKVCLDSCCVAKGTDRVYDAFRQAVADSGARATVKRVGCVGACYRTPLVEITRPGARALTYEGLAIDQVQGLVRKHLVPRGISRWLSRIWDQSLDLLLVDGEDGAPRPEVGGSDPAAREFYRRQVHIAMEHHGQVDPLDLDECLDHDGFVALAKCLGIPRPTGAKTAGDAGDTPTPAAASGPPPATNGSPLTPEQIIETVEQSGLRGRGGAGFPTGRKWRLVRQQPGGTKYVICNGDEGDPGAFMDRMILESFPYRVIEGLAIAALAVGAHEAIFYIRHEYPQALRRVRAALAECERRGWLGDRLLGTDYPFRIAIKEGAGAFVCGEETALIASVEGKRGMPRLRPPFPAESGLWGKPTLINNVETLAMVPWILRHGGAALARIGTASSKGTKVFALAGRVRRAGLIEVPMGTTLREIVEDIGGGVVPGHKFKAVQIGGPSGGCVPARLADTPVDYESLRDIGAIMGSGGMVVLDDTACMVDIARYFLQFTQNQSCGKCLFCRIGTKRMLELLELICAGKAGRQHLANLEALAAQVTQASLCGLGKTAPNPVLTTLRYFRDEYEAHLEGRCPAGKCTRLLTYRILPHCTGCTICAQRCPVNAIPMTPYVRHTIDLERCTRCDSCRRVCPHGAVEVT
jgi:NADH-quinone oxidoreductase subunit F